MRLVKIAGVDLRRFEFDYDLTWFVFFLNADETIYGRYGGRDASDAEARISTKGLRYAMDRALETHKSPPAAKPLAAKPVRAEDFQAAKSHRGCIHCHNINEFRRSDLKALGTWDRTSVWVYPLPENIGITLDNDAGDRVKAVATGSVAEKTGLKPGDRLLKLNGYSVASFGDATYALHKAPVKGSISVSWIRDGREHSGTFEVADGWRKTNLTWRPSMLDILPSLPFSGDELTAKEKQALGLAEKRAAIRQDPEVHATLKAAGVKGGDVLIGYDGKSIDGDIGKLLGFVRRNYLVGDEITLNILRDGKPVDIPFVLK
ncbi:MAG: PDZ domain-containing protein [Planctomycetia bacterium]|nr:PDZ domain-containing protein [Planctomycetia bacterium]